MAACLTPMKSLGGRAWPNFALRELHWEYAAALWANSTLGLIAFWFRGTRQHRGRACLTIKTLPALPMLDLELLDAAPIEMARATFEEFAARDFLAAHRAAEDGTRRELDKAVLVDILGLDDGVLDSLDVLRVHWCAEPSVHGGKGGRA